MYRASFTRIARSHPFTVICNGSPKGARRFRSTVVPRVTPISRSRCLMAPRPPTRIIRPCCPSLSSFKKLGTRPLPVFCKTGPQQHLWRCRSMVPTGRADCGAAAPAIRQSQRNRDLQVPGHIIGQAGLHMRDGVRTTTNQGRTEPDRMRDWINSLRISLRLLLGPMRVRPLRLLALSLANVA